MKVTIALVLTAVLTVLTLATLYALPLWLIVSFLASKYFQGPLENLTFWDSVLFVLLIFTARALFWRKK